MESILCGKYIGQNQQEKLQNAFSLDLLLSMLLAILFTILFLVMGALDLTGFLTRDEAVRPLLNRYLIGQSIGVIPFVLSSQLTAFLSLENRGKRTSIASLVYILTNLVLNFVFVQVLHLEAFGLALASSIGMWVFLGVQAQFFLRGDRICISVPGICVGKKASRLSGLVSQGRLRIYIRHCGALR